jgi:hypothetical protein
MGVSDELLAHSFQAPPIKEQEKEECFPVDMRTFQTAMPCCPDTVTAGPSIRGPVTQAQSN